MTIMHNGVSDELAAFHRRRVGAEDEIRNILFGWIMAHGGEATLGEFRSLATEICSVTSSAMTDAFNMPHSKRAESQ